jgi:hypothetical protein
MKPGLLSLLEKRLSPDNFSALTQTLKSSRFEALAAAFTRCFRWTGKTLLSPDAGERILLQELDADIHWDFWRSDDLARYLIVDRGLVVDPEFCDRISDFFDLQETVAMARILPLLENAENFCDLAREMCRSNSVEVFSAMVCGNPYPHRYFDPATYNQMILKALFLDVALEDIVHWQKHVTSETLRMVQDYACELKAAGRAFPRDMPELLKKKVSL